jgi:FkbM family methyltransferase
MRFEMGVDRNLIFDFGLFDGTDTAFYLAKGFKVVALEARPDLAQAAQESFSNAIVDSQLIIVNRALWSEAGQRIPFYVRSGWSSVYVSSVEPDGGAAESVVQVETTTVGELFGSYGVPHYMKIDIESAERIALEQIAREAARPNFVSIEDPTGELIPNLLACGYDRFQFSNQGMLPQNRDQRPSREGRSARFSGNCSGLFGYDLPRSRWVNAERLAEQIAYWQSIRDNRLSA